MGGVVESRDGKSFDRDKGRRRLVLCKTCMVEHVAKMYPQCTTLGLGNGRNLNIKLKVF